MRSHGNITSSTPKYGTYCNLTESWEWERVGITVYAKNLKTGRETTFDSVAQLKRYADTGRRD